MQRVDLSGWTLDERFSPYPEGSRDKYALIAPKAPSNGCIIPEHRYLMKFSNQRYPVQFWSEIIARIIGEEVGVDVPPCHYAEDVKTGEPGSLIEWFYGDALEGGQIFKPALEDKSIGEDIERPGEVPHTHSLYVPGSSYMARRIENYDLKTGKQHNLKHIGYLIARFRQRWNTDFWPYWAKIVTFDAIIGNTDRHQDNWGVLWRADKNGSMSPRFAPAFDNGTSLLHEITEENISKFRDKSFAERYVLRGRHHVKWEISDERSSSHLDLVKKLCESRSYLKDHMMSVITADRKRIYDRIMALSQEQVTVNLSEERSSIICKIIDIRLNLLNKVITS